MAEWVVDEYRHAAGRSYGVKESALDGSGAWVAQVHPRNATDEDRAEAERRARLFAAAPKLLDAVRALLPWAEGSHDGSEKCDCDRCEVVRGARAALAQAEAR